MRLCIGCLLRQDQDSHICVAFSWADQYGGKVIGAVIQQCKLALLKHCTIMAPSLMIEEAACIQSCSVFEGAAAKHCNSIIVEMSICLTNMHSKALLTLNLRQLVLNPCFPGDKRQNTVIAGDSFVQTFFVLILRHQDLIFQAWRIMVISSLELCNVSFSMVCKAKRIFVHWTYCKS